MLGPSATPADSRQIDFTCRLPDEILAEILAEGHPIIEISPHLLIPTPHGEVRGCCDSPLFSMMGVCRRWRSVVVSTPALWSSFSLNPLFAEFSSSFQASSAFEGFLSVCLARSGDHPLDLLVGSLPSFEKLLALIATSNRWRKLSISYADLSAVVKSGVYSGFPALRYLELHPSLSLADPLVGAHKVPSIAVDAPQLLTFKAGYGLNHYPFQISIPNVTHVHLFIDLQQRFSEITGLLSGLHHLSHLNLRSASGDVGSGSRNSSPVSWVLTLPHLQKLALELVPSVAWAILSRARLPSLKHLRIELLSITRNRANFTQIERDVDLFLSHCPQLESFTSQSVNFTKFKKVLLTTRPRFAAFAHDGQPLTNFEVQSLLRDLILGSDSMEWVEEFALFDAGEYEVDQASVFIDTVVSQCLAMGRATPGAPSPRALRRIDIHSPAPIHEQQMERKLQELYLRGLIPSSTEIQLHYSDNRGGNQCRVAEDRWSTSTGPVTAGWHSTFYPFTLEL